LIILGLILLLCYCLSVNQSASLAIGTIKWALANLSNYRMHIEVNISDIPCFIDVEVRGKINATVITNTCGDKGYVMPPGFPIQTATFNLFDHVKIPPTVDNLFLASSILNITEPNQYAPNGRECDGYYSYSIDYDPILGYPRSIEVVHHDPPPSPNRFCSLVGTILIYPTYTISIKPLP
jgi:hypothetical protein